MLLWTFRVIFIIVVLGVLLASTTSDVMTLPQNAPSWQAILDIYIPAGNKDN